MMRLRNLLVFCLLYVACTDEAPTDGADVASEPESFVAPARDGNRKPAGPLQGTCDAQQDAAGKLLASYQACKSDADCTIEPVSAKCLFAFFCPVSVNKASELKALERAASNLSTRYQAACGDRCPVARCASPESSQPICSAGSSRISWRRERHLWGALVQARPGGRLRLPDDRSVQLPQQHLCFTAGRKRDLSTARRRRSLVCAASTSASMIDESTERERFSPSPAVYLLRLPAIFQQGIAHLWGLPAIAPGGPADPCKVRLIRPSSTTDSVGYCRESPRRGGRLSVDCRQCDCEPFALSEYCRQSTKSPFYPN